MKQQIYFIFFGFKAFGNGFTMGFNGDYTLQTLAFYSDGYNKIWNFLRTGEFPMFDYSNFLGMNYFGTASFYYLTSPFYYLLLLCPKEFIFQGVYFLLLIKYGFGGMFFYILLRKYFNMDAIVVDASTVKSKLKINYDNPKEVGADRIVNAIGAIEYYPTPLAIVDFGTATTFCVVNENNEYLGGYYVSEAGP